MKQVWKKLNNLKMAIMQSQNVKKLFIMAQSLKKVMIVDHRSGNDVSKSETLN